MQKPRKKKVGYIEKRANAGYLMLLPGFLFFAFAILIPFLMGFDISFSDWNGIKTTYNYVGFDNFVSMFKDPRIVPPMKNSLVFAVYGTIAGNVLSLGLAMLVNNRMLVNRSEALSKISRMIFFIPVCFSAILTAFLWKYIYSKVITAIFASKSLLGQKSTVIPAIVGMSLWNQQGINMLIYYSGLKSISEDLYEAALIDGAGSWKRFIHITLPLLTPSFTVCVTLSLTGWLREFAATMAATGGGPANASKTMAIYIYENLFRFNKAGYGQAVAIAFAVGLIVIGQAVSAFFRKREVQM